MKDFSSTERLIANAIEKRMIPGCVCAVGDRDGVKYLKAFGKKRLFHDDAPCFELFPETVPSDAPDTDENTMYDMASCTKVLATTAVTLKLMCAGEFCLSDKVSRFIDVPSDKHDIEIFHLLTHTSGIIGYDILENLALSPDEALNAIFNYPLRHKIGEEVEYSCVGFMMLTKIIEAVTGEKLDVLAKRMVFDPLGMKDTCFNPKKYGYTDFAATEYSKKLKRYKCGEVHDENALFLGGVSGNAGLFSTAGDTAKFALMLARGGDGFLPECVVEAARTDCTPGLSDARGLGFLVRRNRYSPAGDFFSSGSFGHSGYTGTAFYIDPKTSVFGVLLTNRVHFTRANEELLRFRHLFYNNISAVMN